MLKKEKLLLLTFIFFIFLIGFSLRVESADLTSVHSDVKPFFQDQNGLPYMYEMDSYFNYRLTNNYLQNGKTGDTTKNGVEWDLHSNYPPGLPLNNYPTLIIYLTAFLFGIVNLIINIPLMTFCFWLPAFIAPLCGIPAYLIVRKFTNNLGGLTAGLLAVTVPISFIRTIPGFFDKDMLVTLLSYLIIYFLLMAIYSKNQKHKIAYISLLLITVLLDSFTWKGYLYLLAVIGITALVYLVLSKLNFKLNRFYVKRFSIIISVIFASLVVLFLISSYYHEFYSSLMNSFYFVTSGLQNHSDFWPIASTSIYEYKAPNLVNIIFWLGNALELGFLGIVLMFFVLKKQDKQLLKVHDLFFYILLLIWIIVGFYLINYGVRFLTVLSEPLILSAGIGAGIIFEYLSLRQEKMAKTLSIVILLTIILTSIFCAYSTYNIINTPVNDDVWNSAEWIKNSTDPGTIIISHWGYGHLFSAIADRPVTYDGRLSLASREYWVDKAFASSNESLSYGIFRMLATCGDATDVLNQFTGNTSKSVEILNNILGVDRESAILILTNKYNIDEKQANEVIKYTHSSNSNPYVIVTNENLLDRGYWIFYFGNWDYSPLKEKIFYSVGDIKINNSNLNTLNNLNFTNFNYMNKTPYCTMVISNNTVQKKYLDQNSDFCLILLLDSKKVVMLNKEFENSTFTKLVLQQSDDPYFRKIHSEGQSIVWAPV